MNYQRKIFIKIIGIKNQLKINENKNIFISIINYKKQIGLSLK